MIPLTNSIRQYAWGSRTAIATITGRPVPTEHPEAELWIGAHPDCPSTVDGRPLGDLLIERPLELLGSDALMRFGVRLPFLMKVLAAQSSLSLQAHPNHEQAAAGYARDRFATQRTYVDDNHKPELLVAVTDFVALCGFRDPAESHDDFQRLNLSPLEGVTEALSVGDLATATRLLLTWPDANRAEVVALVGRYAERLPADRAELFRLLASQHPGDMGTILALLLNQVRLRPGQAVWMPAGNLHAYISGTGVEIMSTSDNVVRGGLTTKHVDIPELLRVLCFQPLAEPIMLPEVTGRTLTWRVPVPDFQLSRIDLSEQDGPLRLAQDGPRIVLCLEGLVTVANPTAHVSLPAGSAAFAPAAHATMTLSGSGVVFVGSLADGADRVQGYVDVERFAVV